MVQRVGLAQALVNDPELVILDEPMSGLDPVGRREVRDIILELRDEGRTVLFISHVLSDAELLCSGVAILARGRLVKAGTISELTAAGHSRGWELVLAGVTEALAARLARISTRVTRIADGHYSATLTGETRPEPVIAEAAAAGGALLSITPLRTTLEDVFLEALGAAPVVSDGLAPSLRSDVRA
jgi:ABC-2 type transport system ATP-binding protein